MLTPALDRAVRAAEGVRCLSNLKAVGAAIYLYTEDHKRSLPYATNWNTLFGKDGDGSVYAKAPTLLRPLNAYLGINSSPLGEARVAQCPGDLGDPFTLVKNAYQAYGTSYLAAWHNQDDSPTDANSNPVYAFRVKRAFGVTGKPTTHPAARRTSLTPSYNKFLVGDWVWHANRLWRQEQTRWHYPGDSPLDGQDHPGDRRRINALFADGHCELFDKIEVREIEPQYTGGWGAIPADPSWKWW